MCALRALGVWGGVVGWGLPHIGCPKWHLASSVAGGHAALGGHRSIGVGPTKVSWASVVVGPATLGVCVGRRR